MPGREETPAMGRATTAIHRGAGMPWEERLAAGDEMVRLSMGCEDVENLVADLDQALKVIS